MNEEVECVRGGGGCREESVRGFYCGARHGKVPTRLQMDAMAAQSGGEDMIGGVLTSRGLK